MLHNDIQGGKKCRILRISVWTYFHNVHCLYPTLDTKIISSDPGKELVFRKLVSVGYWYSYRTLGVLTATMVKYLNHPLVNISWVSKYLLDNGIHFTYPIVTEQGLFVVFVRLLCALIRQVG